MFFLFIQLLCKVRAEKIIFIWRICLSNGVEKRSLWIEVNKGVDLGKHAKISEGARQWGVAIIPPIGNIKPPALLSENTATSLVLWTHFGAISLPFRLEFKYVGCSIWSLQNFYTLLTLWILLLALFLKLHPQPSTFKLAYDGWELWKISYRLNVKF